MTHSKKGIHTCIYCFERKDGLVVEIGRQRAILFYAVDAPCRNLSSPVECRKPIALHARRSRSNSPRSG